MAASHLLAIDIGTQSVRAVVVTASGKFLFSKRIPLSISRTEEGYIEQDANAILSATQQVIHAATEAQPNIETAALAIQRSTVVAWDQHSGKALCPAVSWQDTRAAKQLDKLQAHTSIIKSFSGLMLSPHYGASKLCWLLNNNPAVTEAYSQYRLHLAPLVSFILFHIVENRPYVCDESNAARTQLWNVHNRRWDTQLCDWFNVPTDLLPDVKPTHAEYGQLAGTTIPLQLVCGDQSAAYYGTGELPEKTAVINIGTGAFLLHNTGNAAGKHDSLLDTLAISTTDETVFFMEGTVNGAGSALKWVSRQADTPIDYTELEQFSRTTEELPVFINAVGGLGSPWWRSDIKPHFLPKHIDCRSRPVPCLAATVESIAFMLHTNLEVLRQQDIAIQQCLVSGGLSRLDSLCQKLASLSHIHILRTAETEATVLGLARLSNKLSNHNLNITQRFSPKADSALVQRYRIFANTISAGI